MSIGFFDISAEKQLTHFGVESLLHTSLSYIAYTLSMLSSRKYWTL